MMHDNIMMSRLIFRDWLSVIPLHYFVLLFVFMPTQQTSTNHATTIHAFIGSLSQSLEFRGRNSNNLW
jgi:hypothetical protein